jgi:molybdopterin-containing oxidoreductase family membrane subunit
MRLDVTSKPVAIPLGMVWAVALIAGLVGVGLRLTSGHELANYTSSIPWGLWIAAYVYFMGLSMGLFLVSAVAYVFRLERLQPFIKLGLLASLVSLLAGLLTIWLDLGQMERFYTVYTRGSAGSMMAWLIWMYTVYGILLVAVSWFVVRADLAERASGGDLKGRLAGLLALGRKDTGEASRESDRRNARMLFMIGIPLAIATAGGSGALFGVVGARHYWNAPLMPVLFIVSAMASGSALLALLVALFARGRERDAGGQALFLLGRVLFGLVIVYALLLWAEYSITLYADLPASSEPAYQVLGGPYPWVFWVFQVALGTMIPLLILLAVPKSPGWVGLAGLLVAASFLATRLNIVIPGFIEPQLAGLDTAYTDSRLEYEYFPSAMEWLVLAFIGAFATGLFALGLRTLPVLEESKEAAP